MFKRILMIAIAAGVLFHGAAYAKNANSIQVKGSDTMVNLVQSWSEEFMKKSPDTFLAVTGGGSGTGISALIGGTCDIAISSRPIKPKEIEQARNQAVEPKEQQVGIDGLAVVVSPKNPVSKLTLDQLKDIFTGKITNWKELGGSDSRIVLLSREVNSGTHVYFKEHVLRKNDPKSREEFSPEALLMPSSQAIADEIVGNASGIGYYGMGYIGKDHKAVAIAKDASSEYYAPTVENVEKGLYPISRPLFIYTNGKPAGRMQEFLEFVMSPEGQKIVEIMDFVPVKR